MRSDRVGVDQAGQSSGVLAVGTVGRQVTEPITERPPPVGIDLSDFNPARIAPKLRMGALTQLRTQYYIPPDVEIVLPGPDALAHLLPVGWLCVNEDHLAAGF